MDPKELERMYRLEQTYWWFGARRQLVRRALRRWHVPAGALILDAGCGTGGTYLALRDTWTVVGVDLSLTALEFARQRNMKLLTSGDVEALPFASGTFDAVLSCDVLEHVEHDLTALCEMYRVTKRGGILVVTAPALPSLWSDHDEALGHLRRYTKEGLQKKLAEAGWKIEWLNYTVTLLMPPIAVFRLIRRLRRRSGAPTVDLFEMPPLINALLGATCRLDGWLAMRLPLPPGASLLAIGRKAS